MVSCDHDGILDDGETARFTVPIVNPGHAPLTNVTVTLTSTTPGVTVLSPPFTIASLAPYSHTDVDLDVALDNSATAPLAGDFSIAIAADGACDPTVTTPITMRLDVDDVAATSATDTFDTATSVWMPSSTATPGWTHTRPSALDGIWSGADVDEISDVSLVSPALVADPVHPLTITVQHRFSFEGGSASPGDGGVIEFTTDGGTTWQDISTLVVPGYTGTLDNASGNPLGGRMAFGGQNASYPAFESLQLALGTQLAGHTFQIRFRIGTNATIGSLGWELDSVAFVGLVGTPFPAQVANTGVCPVETGGDAGLGPDAGTVANGSSGGCCSSSGRGAGNTLLALGALALVLRRRRRRIGE